LTAHVPFDVYDFAITLGGTTVLYAARNWPRKRIPVFPVNLGDFGFIPAFRPTRGEKPLLDYIAGRMSRSERMLLSVRVVRDGTTVFLFRRAQRPVISGNGSRRLSGSRFFMMAFPSASTRPMA
jgi:NAD+ kinase